MYTDLQLTCSDCGNSFTFSADEQEFYASKGFQNPKKCKPCRDAAKQARNSRGGGRPPKQLFDVTCASCGIATQVPFQPSGTKPVYCRDCFNGSSSGTYGS